MSEVERFYAIHVAVLPNQTDYSTVEAVRATDYDTLKANLDLAVGALKDIAKFGTRDDSKTAAAALKQLGIDTGEGR